ncbi:MAG: PHP domain-containing protein [Acidobacteriota bacterium]
MGDRIVATGGFDLHMHSHHSDGLRGPADLAARVAAAGLEGFALTDHDTAAGLGAAAAAAGEAGLRFVPGIEISSAHDGSDLHLLGWFIDPAHVPLQQALVGMADARERRLEQMLAALSRAGAAITDADVRRHATGAVVGRPHMAAALVDAGLATTVQDAFDRWLNRGRPGFVALERIQATEAIALIRAAGGITAVAHPGLGVEDTTIRQLAAAGLAAVEADHPRHSPGRRAHYHHLAASLDLLTTGGSDSHGRPRESAGPGSDRTPAAVVDRLAARRDGPAASSRAAPRRAPDAS